MWNTDDLHHRYEASMRSCGCALSMCKLRGELLPLTTAITVAPLRIFVFSPSSSPCCRKRRFRSDKRAPTAAYRQYPDGSVRCARCAFISCPATTRSIVARKCWLIRSLSVNLSGTGRFQHRQHAVYCPSVVGAQMTPRALSRVGLIATYRLSVT